MEAGGDLGIRRRRRRSKCGSRAFQVRIIAIFSAHTGLQEDTLQSFATSQAYREPPEASGRSLEKMHAISWSMPNLNTTSLYANDKRESGSRLDFQKFNSM
jgi:hypothetical protein